MSPPVTKNLVPALNVKRRRYNFKRRRLTFFFSQKVKRQRLL